MKIDVPSFKGMIPRLTPRGLPENAAQEAINCRLQSGDLESWRHFLLTKALDNAGPVRTIYLLNDQWLSWDDQVDVARSLIPGDSSFLTFLTCPALYSTPRFTTYALATTGAEPYPVATRPLGVPSPANQPTLAVGVDTTPTTQTTNTVDDNASLATAWTVNPPLFGTTYATVTQQTGYYEARYDENRSVGTDSYAFRNFDVAGSSLLTVTVDIRFDADTSHMIAGLIVGADGSGSGVGVLYADGSLQIRGTTIWSHQFGVTLNAIAAMTPLSPATNYKLRATVSLNTGGTKTVVAEVLDSAGTTVLGTVTATDTFVDGPNCGFVTGISDDGTPQYATRYSGFTVNATGSTGYSPVPIAVSYVYTFVNDLGWESAPSPASDTVTRPDGVSVVVTMATTYPEDSAYAVTTKNLYRAVTGATGTVFKLVASGIPLATATYNDVLDDSELGKDVLLSDDWDLPNPDMEGIIALPNGIMAGFFKNQLCLSAQGAPWAWPVSFRLTTDTDIVAIANIDNTIVIGTKSFVYTATGNSPDSFSMSKPGEPQACASKRSMTYVDGFGVVFASPDGFQVCAGSAGNVRNATSSIFTKRQWQALDPTSIVSAVHDGVLHWFYDSRAFSRVEDDVFWLSSSQYDAASWVLSESDYVALKTWPGGGSPATIRGNVNKSSGKRYFEFELTAASAFEFEVQREVGLSQIVESGPGTITVGIAYRVTTGQIKLNGGTVGTGPAVTVGSVIQFAVDLDAGRAWIGIDGTWISGNPAAGSSPSITGITAQTYRHAMVTDGPLTIGARLRGNSTRFLFPAPTGFVAWGDTGVSIPLGGEAAGYVLDTAADGFGLVKLGHHASAVHVDPIDDALYLVLDEMAEPTDPSLPVLPTFTPSDNTVYEFDADEAADLTYRWKGRLNLMPHPSTMHFAKVEAGDFANILARVRRDGAQIDERAIANANSYRIEGKQPGNAYELELLGTSTVRTMQAAQTVEELD